MDRFDNFANYIIIKNNNMPNFCITSSSSPYIFRKLSLENIFGLSYPQHTALINYIANIIINEINSDNPDLLLNKIYDIITTLSEDSDSKWILPFIMNNTSNFSESRKFKGIEKSISSNTDNRDGLIIQQKISLLEKSKEGFHTINEILNSVHNYIQAEDLLNSDNLKKLTDNINKIKNSFNTLIRAINKHIEDLNTVHFPEESLSTDVNTSDNFTELTIIDESEIVNENGFEEEEITTDVTIEYDDDMDNERQTFELAAVPEGKTNFLKQLVPEMKLLLSSIPMYEYKNSEWVPVYQSIVLGGGSIINVPIYYTYKDVYTYLITSIKSNFMYDDNHDFSFDEFLKQLEELLKQEQNNVVPNGIIVGLTGYYYNIHTATITQVNRADNTVLAGASSFKQKLGLTYNNGKFEINKDDAMYSETFHKLLTVAFSRNAESFYTILDNGVFKQNSQNINDGKSILRNAFLSSKFMIRDPKTNKFYYRKDIIKRDIINFIKNQILSKINSPNVRSIDFDQNEVVNILTKLLPLFNFDNDFIRFITTDAITTQYRTGVKVNVKIKVNEETNKKANDNKSLSINDLSEIKFLSNNNLLSVIFNTFNNILDDEVSENLVEFNPLDANYNFLESIPMRVITKGMMKLLSFNISPAFLSSSGKQFYSFVNKNKFSSAFAKILATNIKKWDSRKTAKLKGNLERMIADNPEMKNNLLLSKLISILKKRDNSPALVMAALDYGVLQSTVFNKMAKEFDSATDYLRLLSYFVLWQNTYDITGEGEKVLETITYYPLATTANNPIKRVVKLFKYINTLVSKKDDTVMRNSLKNYGKYKGDITLLEGPVIELSRILKFLSLQNNKSLSSAEKLKLKTLSQFIVYPFLNKNVTIDTLSNGSFRVTIIKDNVPHVFTTDGDFTNDGDIKEMLYSLYYEYIDKLTNENLRYISDKLITDEDPFIALSKKQIINEMILGYIPTQTRDALDKSVTKKLNSILKSDNSFYSKSKAYSGKQSLQYLLDQLLKYQAGNTDDKAIYIPKSVNGKIVTFYTKEELYNEKGKALSEEEIYNALFIINELYEKKINSELSVEIANDNPSESNIQILTKLLKYNLMLTLENNTDDKTVEKASYNVELFNKREYAEVLMYRLLFDMTLNTHLNNVAVSEIMGGDASNFVVSDSNGEILELDTIYNTFKRNTSYRALIIPHDALTKSEIQIERDALGNLTSLSKSVNEKRIFYNGYISDIIEPSNELFKHIMMRESLDVIFDKDIYDILFSREANTSDKNKKVLEDMSNLRKQYLKDKSKVSHDQVFNLFGKLSAKYQDMINEELLEKATNKKSVIYEKLKDRTYFKIKKTDAADQCTFLFFLRRAKSYGYISTQLVDELITAISARIDAARDILITSNGNPDTNQLAQIDMMLDYSDLITPENIKKLKDDFIKKLRQRKVQIPSDLSFDDIVVLTMKDVYVGEYRNENLDIRELIFDKNATRVLTPSSLQNDKLDMLRKMMELLEIDRVSPPSAIKTKVASISYPSSDKSFWNQNFTSIADAIRWSKDNMTVLELNSDDYGEQTPQSASNKALFSAQAKSLIFSSQRHDQEYKFAVLNGNVLRTSPLDRKTASDTFVSFQQLWDKVYSIEREKFLKKVTNADNKIDASKFIAYLKSNLIHSKAISQNDLDGLITLDQLVKMYNNSDLSSSIKKILGEIKSNAELSSKLDNILSDKELKEEDLYKFAIPIMFMPNSFKIQSIMNSMITTRIVDKGLKGVLVPDLQIPFESLTRFQKKNWVNKITLTNPKRWNGMTSLKDMRYENGKIQPAQVVVSWNFKGKSKHMVEFDPTSGTFTEQKQNEDFLSNIEYVTVKVDKKTKNITIHKSNKSNLDDDSLKVIYNKVTQYIKSQGVNVKNIRIYVDDGKYYFEYTSSENSILDINDFLLKEGDEGYQKGKKIIDIRKIPKNILRGFGVRIPTQEKASMVFFEIVGFITGVEQSVMIAPSDFLVRMGSDFDIDTLYSLLYNYIYDQKEQKFIINKYIPESISKHLLRKYYKKYIDKNKEKITRIIDAKVKLLKSNIARLKEENNVTFDKDMKDFKKELNKLIPTDNISKDNFNKIVFDDIFKLSNIFNEINEIIQNSLLNKGNDNYDEYLNRINSVISLFQTLLNNSIKKVSSSSSVGQLIPTMKSESSLEKYIKEMMTKLRYYEYVKSKYHDVQSRNINISDMKKTAINRLNSQIKTNLDDIQLTFENTPKFTKDTNTYANKKSISGISLRYDNIIEIIEDIIKEKENQKDLEEKDKNDIIFLKQLLEKLQDINSNSVSKLVNFLKIIDSASTNDKKSTQLLKVELIAAYDELKEALKQLPTQEEFDKLKTLVKNSTVNNMLIDSFIDDHIKYISTNNKSSLLYKSKKIIKDVIKLHNLNNTKGSNISSKFKLALALTKDSSNMMLYDDFRKKSVIEQNNYNAILNHLKDHYITVMVQPENLKSITLALDYGDVYRDTDTQEIPNDVFETFIKNFTTENNADKRIQLINDLINNYSLASIMDQFNEKLITPDINSWMYNELIYNQMRSSGVLIGAMALNQSFQELLRISGIDVGFNPELSFVKSLIPDISNDPNIKFKVTDNSSVMTGNRFIDETIVKDPINESKGTIDKYREGSLYISLGVDDSKIQAINRINLTILNINPTIGFLSKGFGAHWVMLTINQPIVKQFGELYEKNINNGDKRTDAVKNAYLELMNTYTEMVRELGVSEDSIPQLIADTVPSLDKLMFDLIYNAKSLSTDTNPITKQNYYIHQLAVLRNYMIAYDIGNLFSEIYRKSNTDSKGTPPTYLQTIYKLDDFETIFNNHPLTNIENVFGKVYYLKYIPSLKTMYLEDDILKFERLYEIIQKASPSNLDIDTYSNISINYKGQVYQRGRSTNKDILKQIISDITNTYVNNINLLLSNNNYSMYEKLYILREIYIKNNKQDAIQFITTLLDEFTDKPFIESNINFVQSLVNKLSIGDNEKIFLSEYYLLLSKNNEILRLNNVIVIPSNFKTFAIRDGLSFPRRMFSSYFKYDSELFNKMMNNYYALSGGRIYMGSEKNVKFIESHLLSWLMNSYFKGIDKFQLKETLTQQFILFSKYIDDTLSNNISDDVKFKLSNYKSLLSTLRLDMENGLIMFNPDSINNNAIMFQIFSMMLNDDSKISDTLYEIKDFAHNLLVYWITINGGHFSLRSISSFLPNLIYAQTNFMKYLRNINWDNPFEFEEIDSFAIQLMQSNPKFMIPFENIEKINRLKGKVDSYSYVKNYKTNVYGFIYKKDSSQNPIKGMTAKGTNKIYMSLSLLHSFSTLAYNKATKGESIDINNFTDRLIEMLKNNEIREELQSIFDISEDIINKAVNFLEKAKANPDNSYLQLDNLDYSFQGHKIVEMSHNRFSKIGFSENNENKSIFGFLLKKLEQDMVDSVETNTPLVRINIDIPDSISDTYSVQTTNLIYIDKTNDINESLFLKSFEKNKFIMYKGAEFETIADMIAYEILMSGTNNDNTIISFIKNIYRNKIGKIDLYPNKEEKEKRYVDIRDIIASLMSGNFDGKLENNYSLYKFEEGKGYKRTKDKMTVNDILKLLINNFNNPELTIEKFKEYFKSDAIVNDEIVVKRLQNNYKTLFSTIEEGSSSFKNLVKALVENPLSTTYHYVVNAIYPRFGKHYSENTTPFINIYGNILREYIKFVKSSRNVFTISSEDYNKFRETGTVYITINEVDAALLRRNTPVTLVSQYPIVSMNTAINNKQVTNNTDGLILTTNTRLKGNNVLHVDIDVLKDDEKETYGLEEINNKLKNIDSRYLSNDTSVIQRWISDGKKAIEHLSSHPNPHNDLEIQKRTAILNLLQQKLNLILDPNSDKVLVVNKDSLDDGVTIQIADFDYIALDTDRDLSESFDVPYVEGDVKQVDIVENIYSKLGNQTQSENVVIKPWNELKDAAEAIMNKNSQEESNNNVQVKDDGITHINIYSQGKTELGKLLSNFANTPITINNNKFLSIESWWYWTKMNNINNSLLIPKFTKEQLETVKNKIGNSAKSYFRSLEQNKDTKEFNPTKKQLKEVYELKLEQNPKVKELLLANTLPFAHYYVMKGNKIDANDYLWTADLWREIKNEIQGNNEIKEIISTRIKNSNEHFDNPFSHEPEGKTQGLIKTETIKEAVEKYVDWIVNSQFDNKDLKLDIKNSITGNALNTKYFAHHRNLDFDIDSDKAFFAKFEAETIEKIEKMTSDYIKSLNLERRNWIKEQLQSGNLKNKSILYYKELGEPSHATALDYLINKYNWNTEIPKVNVEITKMSIDELKKESTIEKDAIKFVRKDSKTVKGYFEELSNFTASNQEIIDDMGLKYKSVEAYYQAQKTLDRKEREQFTSDKLVTPHQYGNVAKKLGQSVTLRSDWEQIKYDVMREGLKQKFQDPKFMQILNSTGDKQIIEWTWWGDTIWGMSKTTERGANALGKLLMELRNELQDKQKELNDYKNRNLSKPIDTVQSTNNLSDYTNHSGGALKNEEEDGKKLTLDERRISTDLVWEDIGDNEFGVKTKSYTFKGHNNGSKEDFKVYTDGPKYKEVLERADAEYQKAANALGREITNSNYIKKLMLRNWFQVYYADKIFAIGKINKKNKVDGGTGYAVQMAINNSKPVVVFDLNDNQWKEWDYNLNIWQSIDTPILTKNFAGIGTREITQAGVNAIREVYQKTLNSSEADKPKVLMTPEQYKDWILKSDDTRAKWIREQIKNKQYSGLHIATNRDKTKHASILYSLLNSDQEDIDKIKQDKEDRKNKLIKSIQGIDFTKYKKLIFDAGVLSKFILPLLPKNTITSMGYVITQNKSKERNKVTITISKNSITDDIDITDIITTLNKDKDIQQIIRLDSKYLLDTNQFTSDEIKTIKRTQYDKLNEDIKHKLDLLLLSYIKKALKNLENPFSSENAIKLSNIDVSLISKTDIFKESPMIKDIGTLLRYIKAALFTDSTDIIYDVHQLSLMNANDIFDSINSRIHNKKIVKLFLRQSEYEYVKNTISKKNINLVIKDGSKPYLISLSSAIKISDLESKLVTQKNPVNFTKIRSLTDLRDGNIVGFIITPDFVNGLDIDDTNISIIEDLISNINYGKVKMSRQVFYTFIKKYIKYTSFVSFNRIDDIITNGYLIDITSVTPENSTIIDKNNERLNKMFEELKCINNPNDML